MQQGSPLEQIVPHALLELPQWVAWKLEQREGADKPTKVPYNPRTGNKASSTNPQTWADFRTACRRAAQPGFSGVGIVVTRNDPYSGIDLDDCRDPQTGALEPWAQAIIRNMDSYTEVSPSGKGVRIFIRGKLPPGRKRTGSIEMYDSERFFTVTGRHLQGTPRDIEDRQAQLEHLHRVTFATPAEPRLTQPRSSANEPTRLDDAAIVKKAQAARNGAKFDALWNGDVAAHGGDASRADMALINMLAFYTQDEAQLDRLFRQSGLMRPKWDERRGESTYGARTITAVLSTLGETYKPKVTPIRQEPAANMARDIPKAIPRTDGTAALKPPPPDAEADSDETQAQTLFRLANDAQFFHTPAGVSYARAEVNGHTETWPIGERGTGFRRWLVHRYFQERKSAPGATALTQVMEVLDARATIEGETINVYTRVAAHEDAIYLDLANEAWQSVKITRDGWHIIQNPPVAFRRPNGMQPLPVPDTSGDVDLLREIINVESDSDWKLVVSWLVGALHPTGPYPVLALSGERGSAKTNATKYLRQVIDPSTAPTRDMPKEARDLAIAAHNNWVFALDNLSQMPAWLSDALCRLATGAGFATRSLYTNDSEVIFHARRPIVFNGIEDVATRGDLLDRAIVVTLPTITVRKTERDIERIFTEAHPRILGGLLDAIVSALRHLPQTHIKNAPRMADFAHWVVAAEAGLIWPGGVWLKAYRANREESTTIALDASPVASAVMRFMDTRSHWLGTVTELHGKLELTVDEQTRKQPSWPKSARSFGGMLRRLAPDLRSRGFDVAINHTRDGSVIKIEVSGRDAKLL